MKQYGKIWLGTTIMAFAVNMVYTPANMVTGGVSGLAILVYRCFGIPAGITNYILNIPLLWLGWKIKGREFIKKTIFATFSFSIMLLVIPVITVVKEDLWLATLLGASISGIGLGFVFGADTSTGGSDLAATLLHHWKKRYPVSTLLAIIDGSIVFIGAIVFGFYQALYAIVAVFITSWVMDVCLAGVQFGKAVMVFSNKNEEIGNRIMVEKNRGVTLLEGMGMYEKAEKRVLLCVVSKKEVIGILDIIHNEDKNAFVIVLETKEIFGEGFMESI
ncbi:MAG: YitT family protein [Lachnospiraceae bacterium]|nr:YitT family protein [Lachnospiraceae bacterium]